MSGDATRGSPVLRCMANYYDRGPPYSASSNQTRTRESIPRCSIPGRMANYETYQFDPAPEIRQIPHVGSQQRNAHAPESNRNKVNKDQGIKINRSSRLQQLDTVKDRCVNDSYDELPEQ